MIRSLLAELEYIYRRRYKLSIKDLFEAPTYATSRAVAKLCFGELKRKEMIEEFATWRYGETGAIDRSFLKETEESRRNISVDDLSPRIEVEQPFVSRISEVNGKNPILIGNSTALVLTANGRIIREIAKNNNAQVSAIVEQFLPFNWLALYLRHQGNRLPTQTHLNTDVLPLFQRKYPNYFHWIIDELPKLRAIDYTPNDVTILLERDPPSYVIESLEQLGFSNYSILPETPITVDGVLAVINRNPDHISLSYISQETITWLRYRVTQDIEHTSDQKRVYISRENSGARQVLNREELVSELALLGFESYTLENRSFEENVELFANAEIIVSPHGAGLANIIFSESTAVVELSSLSRPPPHFYFLARRCGHEYRHLTCPAAGDAKLDIQQNMTANVEEVVRTV